MLKMFYIFEEETRYTNKVSKKFLKIIFYKQNKDKIISKEFDVVGDLSLNQGNINRQYRIFHRPGRTG